MIALLGIVLSFGQTRDQARHIDFTKELIWVDNKPLTNPPPIPGEKPISVTLSDVAVTALETNLEGDKGMSAEEHFKLDLLARKVHKSKDCVLTNPEIARVEERIGKFPWASNAVIGAAWRILDPARVESLEKP